jgi:hypothetical protein
MQKFIEQIVKNLESNGFPAKRVSLPMEKMFEVADNKGFSFNAVLDEMKSNHQVLGEIEDEKIVFSSIEANIDVNTDDPLQGMDQAEMMKKAQEMMSQMDPAELNRMKDMFMNMSDEEKADIMKKGKDLGLA